MIRTKGEPGTGDVIQAVRHMRAMNAEIRRVQGLRQDELYEAAKQLQVPVELKKQCLWRFLPRLLAVLPPHGHQVLHKFVQMAGR